MLSPTNRSPRDREEARILYVGSDLELLAVLRAVLKKAEFHIVSCPDRGSAIIYLKSDIRYDLLLFDIEMRDRAALELTELARSLSHREQLPIVIVTANEVVGELEGLAWSSGALERVTKKDLAAIPQTITRLLGLATDELVARD